MGLTWGRHGVDMGLTWGRPRVVTFYMSKTLCQLHVNPMFKKIKNVIFVDVGLTWGRHEVEMGSTWGRPAGWHEVDPRRCENRSITEILQKKKVLHVDSMSSPCRPHVSKIVDFLVKWMPDWGWRWGQEVETAILYSITLMILLLINIIIKE